MGNYPILETESLSCVPPGLPVNFAIYRILGNSLPPRHDANSALRNLAYILEHEAPLPECSKHWILNGLIDETLTVQCRKLIEDSGQECHILPFDKAAYRTEFLDASGLPEDLRGNYPPNFNPTLIRNRLAIDWIYRHKSISAININRARNLAIALGRQHARWTIPLDGGCYFKTEDWLDFIRTLEADSAAMYALIPMLRLESNDGFIQVPGSYPIEPQVAFREDAPDRFDERLRYGNRNKSEFLVRIGAPGPWHTWKAADWDTFTPATAKAPGRYTVAGCAYRLETGATPQVESHERQRHAARFDGVVGMTQALDRQALQDRFTAQSVSDFPLTEMQHALMDRCECVLNDWQRIVSDAGWQALQTLWALPLLTDQAANRTQRHAHAAELLLFMESGKDGRAASLAMNTTGLWMHLLKLALALYTAQWPLASRLLNYAPLRFIAQQTRNASGPPLAFAERVWQINAWVLLARLSAFAGVELRRYEGVQGESIPALLTETGRTGPATPEWRLQPEQYRQWLEIMQALSVGGAVASDLADHGGLMPEGWQILNTTRQAGA